MNLKHYQCSSLLNRKRHFVWANQAYLQQHTLSYMLWVEALQMLNQPKRLLVRKKKKKEAKEYKYLLFVCAVSIYCFFIHYTVSAKITYQYVYLLCNKTDRLGQLVGGRTFTSIPDMLWFVFSPFLLLLLLLLLLHMMIFQFSVFKSYDERRLNVSTY